MSLQQCILLVVTVFIFITFSTGLASPFQQTSTGSTIIPGV